MIAAIVAIILLLIVFWAWASFLKYEKRRPEKNRPNIVYKKYQMLCDDGAMIKYDVKPPNFRRVRGSNSIAMCGTCQFQKKYIDGNYNRSVCLKYDVWYYGFGCLAETICDDYQINVSDEL